MCGGGGRGARRVAGQCNLEAEVAAVCYQACMRSDFFPGCSAREYRCHQSNMLRLQLDQTLPPSGLEGF